MPVSVTMPRLGESVTEGTVTRWLKREGDHVDADEPLLEVSTDKVDTEVPSPASGTVLAIRVGEDETVEIGVELAVIGEIGEAAQTSAPTETPQAPEPPSAAPEPFAAAAQPSAPPTPAADEPVAAVPVPAEPEQLDAGAPPASAAFPAVAESLAQVSYEQPAVASVTTSEAFATRSAPAQPSSSAPPPARSGDEQDELGGPYVTPLVRKLASERGVDLAEIRGTGVGGRIRKSDVLAATVEAPPPVAAQPAAVPRSAPAHAAPPPPGPSLAPPSAAPAHVAAAAPSLRGRVEPMSRMRQVIATRMVESLQTSAQLTTVVEVDVTKISRLREQAKAGFFAREGVRLTFLPFFAVAAIEALKAHPVINASIDMAAKTVTYHDAEHVGIAVDTDRGLAVPVIHNAGDLNLAGIGRKIADLAERMRANRVSPDELGGGTFTLTNTGSRGALFDTPIINQPQVAILGTGAVVRRPVVVADAGLGETIAIRSMVYFALSYDHRIVDGADAARFLTTVKQRLEAGAFERALGLPS